MKNLFFIAIVVLLSQTCFAQSFYWTVYHFDVKSGDEDAVVAAFDKFFNSETGKTLPYASLSANLFGNSSSKWSHELLFATDSKEAFGKMYTGQFQQSDDFSLLEGTLDQSMTSSASYLGKSVIAGSTPENRYSTVYELSVSDPASYAAAFTKFKEAIIAKVGPKMGLDLHQFMSGAETGATHAVVASAPTFEDLLDFTDATFSSDAYKTFSEEVKNKREILRIFSNIRLLEWNAPDGM